MGNPRDLRREYQRGALDESTAPDDPLALFDAWFAEAVAAGLTEPNAMTLATVGADGRPAARIVLLKGRDDRGFSFYTNYESRKAREIAARPFAALVFLWTELERQVRVEGRVERLDPAESDAYFAVRPRASQLGAWASNQSGEVPGRAELEARLAEVTARFEEGPVPRPPHWGGYVVLPDRIEFWQGRRSRMHDRFEYVRTSEEWSRRRLAP